MRDLSGVQHGAAREFLRRRRRPYDGWSGPLREPARPGAVDLGAIALEAERVVAIGANRVPVPEPGFPFPARRAERPEAPRPTMTFAARHEVTSRRLQPGRWSVSGAGLQPGLWTACGA